MKTIAVIPAYNEEQTIADVLQKARPFVDAVVVVDDGSADRTGEIARTAGALVIRHAINRGLGAALATGFAAARQMDADAAVTLDADGQHDPVEMEKLLAGVAQGADVVIGSRLMRASSDAAQNRTSGMPLHRILANTVGNLVTWMLFGAWVSDSQSGYRALSRHALNVLEIKTNRMEVSSEIIAEARRHGLELAQVPIRAIYTHYSLSKGQSFFTGLKTALKLVLRRMH